MVVQSHQSKLEILDLDTELGFKQFRLVLLRLTLVSQHLSISALQPLKMVRLLPITTSFFGSNLDQNNPPLVVIDGSSSLFKYSTCICDGTTGVGTGAKVDVKVGQGSSVIEFELVSGGFGYGESEELRLSIGGTTGIQNYIELALLISLFLR